MSNNKKYNGVYALLLTPFHEDRSIDFKALEQYAEFQAEQCKGNHLFAVCGSSEMDKMNIDERIKVAETVVKHAGDTPVVATANLEPSWHAQVDEVIRMEATGVSGLVFVTKSYGDDQERMFTYLSELSTYSNLPIMLYEYPGTKPHKMDGETYGKLVETGRFIAIKDTTCTMAGIKAKIDVQGESSVLQANIPLLYDAYVAGARGVCATPTSCGAELFAKMWREFDSGDREAAKQTYHQIILLDNAVGDTFPATAKYYLNLRGIKMNWYTRGTHQLSESKIRGVEAWYDFAKYYGIIK